MNVFEDVTVHMMCRDEPLAHFALLSVLPFIHRALVIDTGSTDETYRRLEAVKMMFPEKHIVLRQERLQDSTKWSLSERPIPNYELSACRQRMIEETETRFIWVVDGDEVYLEETAKAVVKEFRNWPIKRLCAFVPLIWFGRSKYELILNSLPKTYPFAGRLFIREGLSIVGFFPGELHGYDGVAAHWSFSRMDALNEVTPLHHYEILCKPWRRKVLSTMPYEGTQPEVFDRCEQIIKLLKGEVSLYDE